MRETLCAIQVQIRVGRVCSFTAKKLQYFFQSLLFFSSFSFLGGGYLTLETFVARSAQYNYKAKFGKVLCF